MTGKKTVGQERILIKTRGGGELFRPRTTRNASNICPRKTEAIRLTEGAVEGEGMPVVSPRPRAQVTGGESVGGNTLLR